MKRLLIPISFLLAASAFGDNVTITPPADGGTMLKGDVYLTDLQCDGDEVLTLTAIKWVARASWGRSAQLALRVRKGKPVPPGSRVPGGCPVAVARLARALMYGEL